MKLSLARSLDHWLQNRSDRTALAWLLAIIWLLLLGGMAFFWRLGSNGLLDETEPLFVEAARQMTVTGDWITPYFNGETRFDKPPLIYWSIAIAFHALGVNEWAARLPSAIAGLCLVSFCFYVLKRYGIAARAKKEFLPVKNRLSSPSQLWLTAGLGATMLALHPLTFFFGRLGYSDMLLSACFGGGLFAFFLGYAQTELPKVRSRWYLTFYILIALAILTKGPVGIVLPGLIIFSFLVYLGKVREVLREMSWLRGMALVLAITVPWYILVTLANGEAYIDSFFGVHNFERFTSVVNEHQGPWYFHFIVVLLGFAPWSIYLPVAIARIQPLQRQHWQDRPRSHHLGLFAVFWFVGVLGFFTVAATKYFSYTLPLMPAASIIVALWWSDRIAQTQSFRRPGWGFKLSCIANLIFLIVLAFACYYSPNWLEDDPSMPNIGARIQQATLPIMGAAIWLSSAIACLILVLKRQHHRLWGVNLIGFVAFLIFVAFPFSHLVDLERQLPLRQLAQAVTQVRQPGEELVMLSKGFPKPSLVFYTQHPVTYVLRSSRTSRKIRQILGDRQSDTKSVLLIAPSKALAKTGLTPQQSEPISQAGIYQLLRVR
ncbi:MULTISPECIES: ArnT family glycosyltransferase [Chroococcidiopsis]|jgi:4-amino-4-deoxy-L-arabinose transferase-like glycosyltransferase|uniref:Glycosyl transferase family 39 n=2 Tax=Chroococcidiopsis TaxID=54298 RepID=K9U2C6_CHRTP|nr:MULTISPECIES: glycosyltransferase family 39 protein [Chroococcidiopsis]AFY88990.1 glycosyl transferase family 39 [Chroococcidiopsis thermalis PCC 7203]PSB48812.1 glycosyltransferase family 39 protein [Cyanosarcina cf. burmensis CCALA 770]URD48315.1 glycosyltransferase family 39 protein [Chroococcidiopsis sp. CCNUC1]